MFTEQPANATGRSSSLARRLADSARHHAMLARCLSNSASYPNLFSFHHAPRGEKKILWTKGKASAIEIWVDRNDGNGFVFLIINTEPNTTDTTPLPAPGTSAVWNYKAIYRLHDEQVGQWSDVVSVTVGG
ncbi:MAG: hypothetical protein NTX45_08280 [Proteobacteria bacterium]|nr:hypothetical protein [Pseudomonadota bacterium]